MVRRTNETFHIHVETQPRDDSRRAHSQSANRITLSATTLAVDPPIPSTIRIVEEESPSTLFQQEVASTRKHVSSDKPKHRFWLSSDLEVPLAALESVDGHAGHVVHNSSNVVFVEEIVKPGRLVIPYYIAAVLPVYTEAECRTLFRQVCQHIQVLHDLNTVHRNIHLNHLVVDQTGHASLRGFQHAVVLKQRRTDNGVYYTEVPLAESRRPYDWYAFRAPELEDDGPHGTAVDIWSAGICLYMLLTGLPPFRGSGRELRRQKMHAELADYDIVLPSKAAQDLVEKMVTEDPAERLTIDQVLEHEWLKGQSDATVARFAAYDLSLSQVFLQDWGRKSER